MIAQTQNPMTNGGQDEVITSSTPPEVGCRPCGWIITIRYLALVLGIVVGIVVIFATPRSCPSGYSETTCIVNNGGGKFTDYPCRNGNTCANKMPSPGAIAGGVILIVISAIFGHNVLWFCVEPAPPDSSNSHYICFDSITKHISTGLWVKNIQDRRLQHIPYEYDKVYAIFIPKQMKDKETGKKVSFTHRQFGGCHHVEDLEIGVGAFVFCLHGESRTTSSLDKVNMFIGTSYSHNVSDNHDYGNTMLNIGVPFAHTPWSAQTRSSENKCESPYYYFDPKWRGMRRTHWMSGSCVIDYGTASILPSLTLDLKQALNYHSMNHSNEHAQPSYYKMFLQESNVEIEAASKNAAGIFRSRMISNANPSTSAPSSECYYLLFLASDSMYNQSSVEVKKGHEGAVNTIVVHSPVHRWYQSKGEYANFDGHHVFKLSHAPVEYGIIHGYTSASNDNNVVEPNATFGRSSKNGPAVVYLKFRASDGDVTVATACSFISADKAELNLNAELNNNEADSLQDTNHPSIFDLEAVVNRTTAIWEEQLSVVQVGPSTHVENTPAFEEYHNNTIVFYTALWHSLLLPRVISDSDGAYWSFTDNNRTLQYTQSSSTGQHDARVKSSECDKTLSFDRYFDDFSMWDIFRAQVPLLHLILPSNTVRDMVASLVVKAQQGHWMPIFPAWNSYTGEMVGDHCAVWIADAVLKGLITPDDPVLLGFTPTQHCPHSNDAGTLAAEAIESVVGSDAATSLGNRAESHGALYYTLKNALLVPVSYYAYAHSRGRRALTSHLQYGYIPLEDLVLESPHPRQQVSRSLEYAYDDYVLSQLLQFVIDRSGEKLSSVQWDTNAWRVNQTANTVVDTDTTITDSKLEMQESVSTHALTFYQSTLNKLRERSTYYMNVIDPSVGFVRGRHNNGSFTLPDTFDPTVYYSWITETNVWQYTWFVPHNIEDMIELYGGNAAFAHKLNTFFSKGYYNHGNEPDHHAAYLSAYIEHSGEEERVTSF